MNQKLNWTTRGRINGGRKGIPVRFGPDAIFAVKIKNFGRNPMLNFDPLIPEFSLSVRTNERERLKTLLAPFNRAHAMASVTLLDELHLDERRLYAVLKNARKKRC
ncbi:MAG TPA: hypothetical protein VGY56_07790 [Verrucomicrobiae bacterium]|nr:hypothetical protein [Verrucomicrobiae bacterium]